MAITLTTTQANSNADYSKYLFEQNQKTQKTDRYNDSDLMDFALVPYDASFVKLNRGAYVTFASSTYPIWYTGYITNDPELDFLGAGPSNTPIFGYKYQATSDDYLLSLNSLGILAPFMNTNMGNIIKILVERIAPGKFDVSNVGTGSYIADYVIDPSKRFADLIKDFCTAASYQFYCKNHVIYFVPQDSASVGFAIDGNDQSFTPSNLTLQPSQTPLINDVTVLGDKEPQTYYNEYFVGSGLDGQFPLSADVFGVDRYILLDEDFSASSLDSSKWNLYDTAANYLQLSNGYLNAVGGPQDGTYSVNLQSVYSIPIDGNLRITHGEWDFLQPSATSVTHGVICGLWLGQPAANAFGCIYGLSVYHDSQGVLRASPIVDGFLDSTQSVVLNTTKRYVIRTVLTCQRIHRLSNVYTYTDAHGNVSSYGGGADTDTGTWQTFFNEIDATTGLSTGTFVLNSENVPLGSNAAYAVYIPVITDSLHATVSGITVSIPLQVSLEQRVVGDTKYTKKLVGPNEIDASDNFAPVATVTQGNTGSSTTSTFTGMPQYNPGHAQLTYFKDTTRQLSTIPKVGELVHVSYRSAGSAAARLRAQTSISSEAAVWGDNGVRSIVRNGDIKPRPRNARECELAAAAILGDSSYQHFEGKYTILSKYVTSEPLSGRILKFQNLPSTVPSYLKAEEVTEVITTLLSSSPTELFQHDVSFGKTDHLRQAVGKFNEPIGLFEPDDQAGQTQITTVYATGNASAFGPDVLRPTLETWDNDNYYINTNQQAPLDGGFEVRYTDASWGSDDGKNLLVRTQSSLITIPRNYRTRTVFISAYDGRNRLLYSEDQTRSPWTLTGGATATNAKTNNPDYDRSTITNVVMPSGGVATVEQVGLAGAYGDATFSVSLSGTGNVALIMTDGSGTVRATSPTITLSSGWQRISLSHTFAQSGNITVRVANVAGSAANFRITRASLESGVLSETAYAKTLGSVYGANSRYPSAVHISLPLLPAPPTATLDYSDPKHPVVAVTLPTNLQDVWGVEIRMYDNTTSLYHKDLVDATYNPSFTDPGNVVNPDTKNIEYYVYTYNLLGEYCTTPLHLTNSDDIQLALDTPYVGNAPADGNGNLQSSVIIGFTPPSNSQWDRVNVYLRAPAAAASATTDVSNVGTVGYLASLVLKATVFYETEAHIIAFAHPSPSSNESWEVVVIPASSSKESVASRVSTTFTVGKPTKTSSDASYLPFVQNLTYKMDLTNTGGITTGGTGANTYIRQTSDGTWQWRIELDWTNAEDDPRFSQISYYAMYLQEPDGTEVPIGGAVPRTSTSWISPWHDFPSTRTQYDIFVVTFGGSGAFHNVVTAATPFVTFIVDHPGSDALLTDVSNFSVTATYGFDSKGGYDYILSPKFIKPNDPGFNAVLILGEIPEGSNNWVVLGAATQGDGSTGDALYLPKAKYPKAVETWGLYAVGLDKNNQTKFPVNARPGNSPYFALTTSLPPLPPDPTGLTVSAAYSYNAMGHLDLILHASCNIGPDDPARGGNTLWMRTQGGAWYSYDFYGSSGLVDLKVPIAKNIAPLSADEVWDFYVVPYDRLNNFKYPIATTAHDPGAAPHVTATIPAPLTGNPVGQEYASLIQGFTLVKDSYGTTLEGLENHGMTFSWTVPNDPRIQSVSIQVVIGSNDPHEIAFAAAASGRVASKPHVIPYSGSWTIYCVSVDASGRMNTIAASTPKITHGVTAQTTGKLDATRLDPAKLNSTDLAIDTVNQKLKINQLDLAKVLPSSINTPEFKISADGKLTMNGIDFSKAILSTLSSEFQVLNNAQLAMAQIDLTKAKALSYSGEFQFNAGNQFAINFINAAKINTGQLGAQVIYAGTIGADKITTGQLAAGVVYAGSIAAAQITTGVISAAITMTSPSLHITAANGDAVLIDNTNYVKVQNSSSTAYLTPGSVVVGNYTLHYQNGLSNASYGDVVNLGNDGLITLGGGLRLSSQYRSLGAGHTTISIDGIAVLGKQQPTLTQVAATLGATYTTTEQTKLNTLLGEWNKLLVYLGNHGLIATPAGGWTI